MRLAVKYPLVSRLVNKCSIVDAVSEAGGGLSPAKWLGVLVPLRQPRHDGFLQAGDIVEAAATDGLAGNQREPALDQVEPGSAGRGEMQLETGMGGQPLSHRGMLVSAIVIADQMQLPVGIAAGQ